MTQRRSSASDTSKLPKELQELLNRSSNDVSSGEVKELRDCFAVQGPVSYTHLDVYKRQDVGISPSIAAVHRPQFLS